MEIVFLFVFFFWKIDQSIHKLHWWAVYVCIIQQIHFKTSSPINVWQTTSPRTSGFPPPDRFRFHQPPANKNYWGNLIWGVCWTMFNYFSLLPQLKKCLLRNQNNHEQSIKRKNPISGMTFLFHVLAFKSPISWKTSRFLLSSMRITACRDKPGGWRVCAWRRQQSMSLSRHKCAHHVLLQHLVPQCTKMVFRKESGPWLIHVLMWTVDMTDFSKGKIQNFINSGRTRHPGLNLLSFFLLPFSKVRFLPLVVKKNPRKLNTKSRPFWVDPPAAGRSFPANPPYSKDLAVGKKKCADPQKCIGDWLWWREYTYANTNI